MNDLVRRANETSSVLRGRRVFYFHRWLPASLALALMIAGAASLFVVGGLGPLTFLAAALVGAVVAQRGVASSREAIRLNNEAVRAVGRADFGEAERLLGLALGAGGTTLLASIALENLAGLALRRGAFDEAADLARAALSLAPARRDDRRSDFLVRPYATLAKALVCGDRLDEAERVLAEATVPEAGARDRMFLVPARALLALRRARYVEVIELLDAHRALARNAYPAETTALVEAMEGIALARLGGAYRGMPRKRSQLPCDARTRAFVERLVPGGSMMLTELASERKS